MSIKKNPEKFNLKSENPDNLKNQLKQAEKTSENNHYLNKKGNIQETVSKLTGNKLDLLKDGLPEKKLLENIAGDKNYSLTELLEENPFVFKESINNIDAGIHTLSVAKNTIVGLGKGLINTPRDLISWIKGEKTYSPPKPL